MTDDMILGIDVGGSGIKGATVNVRTGELLTERFRVRTPQPATPAAVVAGIGDVTRHFDWHGPIGMGFPAVVKDGVAHTAANIDPGWIGTSVRDLTAHETGCPVAVLNDADAAGLAEMRFGAGRDHTGVVMMVTLGTGIGTAIFNGGVLVPNTELGHLVLRDKEAEHRASAAVYEERGWSHEKWGERLTEYFAELERLLWPDLFIIGGGGSKEWDGLGPHIAIRTPMIPAQMLNLAGIVGAALAADNRR